MDVKIIYEDPDFIIIDKPSGIVVNKSETTKEETIQDWAENKLKIKGAEVAHENTSHRQPRVADDARQSFPRPSNVPRSLSERRSQSLNDSKAVPKSALSSSASGLPFASSIEEEFRSRGGVVHRLDKETSGILLIAKNPQSFLNLKNQFKERKTEKVYIALVHGEVKPGKGEINVPVGRLPYNRTRFGIVPGGREAHTEYRVISNFIHSKNSGQEFQISNSKQPERLTLLGLYPKTGRTHQIRVHLKYINHSIFADPLYAGRKTARSDRKILPRLFLHASKLSFNHPVTGERLTFESPLPNELGAFISRLDLSNSS